MQKTTNPTLQSIRNGLACFGITTLLAVGAASAQVASGTTGIDATGSTQSEKRACHNGMTQQDHATCMREANNAAGEKSKGQLATGTTEFQANALKRCDVLSGEDKIACQARIVGYGSTSGSVAGGGVVRQVETVVVPADAGRVQIQPKTSSDIVVIPATRQ